MIACPKTPIADYVNEVFLGERKSDDDGEYKRKYLQEYTRAVKWFSAALKRECTLADLTPSNLYRLQVFMYEAGSRKPTVHRQRHRLIAVWRHAHKAGVLMFYEQPPLLAPDDKRYAYLSDAPNPTTVYGYFTRFVRGNMRPTVQKDADAAIKNLDKFQCRYVPIREVDERLLDEFDEWLTAKAICSDRIARYKSILRNLVNSAISEGNIPDLSVQGETRLADVLEELFFSRNVAIRTEQTRKQYRIALRDFEDAVGRPPMVSDLTDDNVARMMQYLGDRELAAKTINERRGRIHTLWQWLTRRGVLQTGPTTGRIPEPVRTPVAWTEDEVSRLFESCRNQEGWIGRVQASVWWTSLHYVLWDTGERIRALLRLPWEFVDLQSGWITIPAELRKGKRSDRAYKVRPETVAALELAEQPMRELVWPWPYHETYLWTKYRGLLKEAGLPATRHRMFHCMRRSVASHFESAGGDATAFLGHCSRKVTEGYLDPRIVPQVHAAELLPFPGANRGEDGHGRRSVRT